MYFEYSTAGGVFYGLLVKKVRSEYVKARWAAPCWMGVVGYLVMYKTEDLAKYTDQQKSLYPDIFLILFCYSMDIACVA